MRNDNSSFVTSATADTGTVASSDMDLSFVNVLSNVEALQVLTSPKHNVIGLESGLTKTQVCVNMKARDLPDDDSQQRAPVDIILALDVSGSMSGTKLALCKKTLDLLLRVLYPDDRFGLICYSDMATIEIPAQKMNDANKSSCAEKIQGLRAHGCTNMSAAVGLAFQEMRQIQNPNEVQTIFFLTDGHANAGISNASSLVEFTSNCSKGHDSHSMDLGTEGAEDQSSRRNWWGRSQHQKKHVDKEHKDAKPPAKVVSPEKVQVRNQNPITMHCFGFGGDHNSSLLQAMSDIVPGGSYYFVENDANVKASFGDALGGVLSIVAQNVSVIIRVPDEAKAMGVSIVDIYHDHKVKRDDGSYTVVVGDFYSEESRDVLFEVKLADGNIGSNEPILHTEVFVAYTDTLQKAPADASTTACLIARPPGKETSAVNNHVAVQWTRVKATQAMSQANAMAQANDIVGARAFLSNAQMEVQAARQAAPNAFYSSLDGLDNDMTELSSGLRSPSMYRAKGSHTFQTTMASHRQQRSMMSGSMMSDPASNLYSNKMRCSMRRKFNN